MTKERIKLKDIKKKCPKCDQKDLDFIDVDTTAGGFRIVARCGNCGSNTLEVEKTGIAKEGLLIELLYSKSRADTNFWLIRRGNECFKLKSSKASMPNTSKLPNDIQKEVDLKIGTFLGCN